MKTITELNETIVKYLRKLGDIDELCKRENRELTAGEIQDK